jgi:hypothetical protein
MSGLKGMIGLGKEKVYTLNSKTDEMLENLLTVGHWVYDRENANIFTTVLHQLNSTYYLIVTTSPTDSNAIHVVNRSRPIKANADIDSALTQQI